MIDTKIIPNPTDAKDVAMHFIRLTTDRMTPSIIARTINQAKNLLSAGYTKDELIKVIDYVVNINPSVYSLGYVSASINDVLRKIEEEEREKHVKAMMKQVQDEVASAIEKSRDEVSEIDDSTERNRARARRTGIQSRFGKKFNFDMFEGK